MKCGYCNKKKAVFVCCSPDAAESRKLCEDCLSIHMMFCAHEGNNMVIRIDQTDVE